MHRKDMLQQILTWAIPQRFAYFLHCGFLSLQVPVLGAGALAAE